MEISSKILQHLHGCKLQFLFRDLKREMYLKEILIIPIKRCAIKFIQQLDNTWKASIAIIHISKNNNNKLYLPLVSQKWFTKLYNNRARGLATWNN